jgi:hypothetical protein
MFIGDGIIGIFDFVFPIFKTFQSDIHMNFKVFYVLAGRLYSMSLI